MNGIRRAHDRAHDQLRDIKISCDVFGYAPGSVLFEQGNTKVLCSVSLQSGVPLFLKGTKTGWLTAEYAMLPTSGHTRAARESSQAKRNDRSVEISRLIGRSLRAVVDLASLQERTIFVDCDVLQADGSTRTAAITGSYIALKRAVDYWIKKGDLSQSILIDALAAISVGFQNGQALLDLDFAEDSAIEADYNFVLTKSEKIIEIQGCSEKKAISWNDFDVIKQRAFAGNKKLFEIIDTIMIPYLCEQPSKQAPLFSLQNRFNPGI